MTGVNELQLDNRKSEECAEGIASSNLVRRRAQ